MANRPQIWYVVTDQRTGKVIQNAKAYVYETTTTTLVADLFAAPTGGAAIASAELTSNAQGEVEGYPTTPRNFALKITDNGGTAYYAGTGKLVSFPDFTEDPVPAYEDPVEEETDDAAFVAHLADVSDAHDASAVSFSPDGGIAATDVQAAILEVAQPATGIIDANIAPYSVSTGQTGAFNSAALTTAVADAVAAAVATNGTLAIVELDAGEYDVTRAPVTTNGCYAQIPLPKVATTSPRVMLLIRAKQAPVGNPGFFFQPPTKTGVVLRSTRTGETYSGTNGIPSIIGGPDAIHGTTILSDASWMTLHTQGIAFRQPPNPSMCCVNAQMIDRCILENFRCDTTDMDTTGHFPTQPTNACGIANLPPINLLDGYELRGTTEVGGYFAGPAIGELMSNQGVIFSYENYVALNFQSPWSHAANLGHVILVRCPYDIAHVDSSLGGVAAADAIATPGLCFLTCLEYDTEDATTTWRTRVTHIYDPSNKMAGTIEYLRVVAGVGATAGALTLNGGDNLDLRDRVAVRFHDRADRTSGNILLNATSWTDLTTSMDLLISANPGDWVTVSLSGVIGNEAVASALDAVSIVGGVPQQAWGSNGAAPSAITTGGVEAWLGISGAFSVIGGSVSKKIVAADIDTSTGLVRIRLRAITGTAANKTLYATAADRLSFEAHNMGRTGRLG